MFKVLMLKLPVVGGALGLSSIGVYFGFNQENPLIKKKRQFIFWGPKYDVILGKYVASSHRDQLEKEGKILSKDTPEHQISESSSKLIIDSLEHYIERPWNIQVIKDNSINAYVFPDGSVFVNTGLLDQIRTPDELIFILSHEVSHAELRHSANSLCTTLTARVILALVLGIMVPDFADVLGRWITSYLFQLPNSRRNEQEADEYGVKITKFLGFNPLLAIDFFEHLKKVHGDHIEYLSTHPSNDHRIENIRIEHENTGKLFLENNITRDKDLEQKALKVAHDIKVFINKRGPPK